MRRADHCCRPRRSRWHVAPDLARRFKDQMGTSPGHWLLAQRIAAAQALPEQTDLPVESIASRVGLRSATNDAADSAMRSVRHRAHTPHILSRRCPILGLSTTIGPTRSVEAPISHCPRRLMAIRCPVPGWSQCRPHGGFEPDVRRPSTGRQKPGGLRAVRRSRRRQDRRRPCSAPGRRCAVPTTRVQEGIATAAQTLMGLCRWP